MSADEAPVLPFPQTKRALRHYRSGMAAAGFLTLLLLERDGDPIPANVQRIDEPDGITNPEQSPALLLALLIWNALPTEQRDSVSKMVSHMAYGDAPSPAAVQLNNALRGRF